MRKIFLLLSLSLLTINYGQEKEKNDFPKNEIKGNALLLVAGAFEGTYERILKTDNGAGISLYLAITDDFETKFALTPYYRFYFGKKPAAGFFVEGFGSINSYNDYIFTNQDSFTSYYKDISRTDFALGFGLGSKWVARSGFIFEINAGIGRNLFNSSDTDHEILGRGGITLGYRF